MIDQGNPQQIVVPQPSPSRLSHPNGHVDLKNLNVPPDIKFLIQHGDTIGQHPSSSETLSAVLSALVDADYDDELIARLCLLEGHGISELPRQNGLGWFEEQLNQTRRNANNLARQAEGEPERGRDLLADRRPPSKTIVDGLLREGMILFGGKPKRGKSWLMLDLALSVGTGKPVWGHFPVPESQPVLYIGLEDGRDDIRDRVLTIQPGITDTGKLEFLYSFPRLNEGGLEKLRGFAKSGRYRLIIIDVLARIEPRVKTGKEKGYHDIYEMLTPLQDMRHEHPLCLILVTHLRKAEAEDIFDGLHGSVAYQGAQDALWVLERPLSAPGGIVHILARKSAQQSLHVSLADGRWDFLGHDDEINQTELQRGIRELYEETDRSLTIREMTNALSGPRDSYNAVKKTVYRMLENGQMIRITRGRYAPAQGTAEADEKRTKGP